MNSHLNIFKTYTKENREVQLENDLTRAFAICLQEDSLFLHSILKTIFKNSFEEFDKLFDNVDNPAEIEIDIQRPVKKIESFEKIFAVALSEHPMEKQDFWNSGHDRQYDPICDVVVTINNGVVIIFEAKRDNVDCTKQLYNQAFNIIENQESTKGKMRDYVEPIDLNWPKLMKPIVQLSNFEKSVNKENRFLSDFIQLVKQHNFKWLPEPAISSLKPVNTESIIRRIESAVEDLSNNKEFTPLKNRLGFEFPLPWAQELNFRVNERGSLIVAIHPGNTKGQGTHIFKSEGIPTFNSLELSVPFKFNSQYHIKLTSFQRYFTGLWFTDEDLEYNFYNFEDFKKYAGRKKRGQDWDEIEQLFDKAFIPSFNWREKIEWTEQVLESGKTQFDFSFGYEVTAEIEFNSLKQIDLNKDDLTGLKNLLKEIYEEFQTLIN